MKAAISVPDELFARGERSAAERGWTRSELYARALDRFLAEQEDDPVTAALDALADDAGEIAAPNAGRGLIDAGRWEW